MTHRMKCLASRVASSLHFYATGALIRLEDWSVTSREPGERRGPIDYENESKNKSDSGKEVKRH